LDISLRGSFFPLGSFVSLTIEKQTLDKGNLRSGEKRKHMHFVFVSENPLLVRDQKIQKKGVPKKTKKKAPTPFHSCGVYSLFLCFFLGRAFFSFFDL
jgi:hypothetical protein